jgi:hypothetical protein
VLAQAKAPPDLYRVGWTIKEEAINWNSQPQPKKRGARARGGGGAGTGAAEEEALRAAQGVGGGNNGGQQPGSMSYPPSAPAALPAPASSDKRKTASTGEGDPAGKRARAGDGGVDDDRGDFPVRISSSREPMSVQGLGGSSTSVAISAEAAGSGASKVPSKDPPATAASAQLQDSELQRWELQRIGPALLSFGISQLSEMRNLLHTLSDNDLEEQSEFRRHVSLTPFQVRNLRLWRAELELKLGIAVVDLTEDDVRVKPERPAP